MKKILSTILGTLCVSSFAQNAMIQEFLPTDTLKVEVELEDPDVVGASLSVNIGGKQTFLKRKAFSKKYVGKHIVPIYGSNVIDSKITIVGDDRTGNLISERLDTSSGVVTPFIITGVQRPQLAKPRIFDFEIKKMSKSRLKFKYKVDSPIAPMGKIFIAAKFIGPNGNIVRKPLVSEKFQCASKYMYHCKFVAKLPQKIPGELDIIVTAQGPDYFVRDERTTRDMSIKPVQWPTRKVEDFDTPEMVFKNLKIEGQSGRTVNYSMDLVSHKGEPKAHFPVITTYVKGSIPVDIPTHFKCKKKKKTCKGSFKLPVYMSSQEVEEMYLNEESLKSHLQSLKGDIQFDISKIDFSKVQVDEVKVVVKSVKLKKL